MGKGDPEGRRLAFGREPVAYVTLVAAVLTLAASFGLDLTQAQQGGITIVVLAVVGFAARQSVFAPKSPKLVGGGPPGPDHGGLSEASPPGASSVDLDGIDFPHVTTQPVARNAMDMGRAEPSRDPPPTTDPAGSPPPAKQGEQPEPWSDDGT